MPRVPPFSPMNHSPISSKGPQKYAPHSPCFSLIQIGQEMCCNMCYKGDSLVSVVILFLRFRLIMTNDMSVTSRTSNSSEVRWYCMCVAYVYTKIILRVELHLHQLGWYASSTKGREILPTNSDKKNLKTKRSVPRNNNYWSPPRSWRVQCRYNRPLCCPALSDGYGHPTLRGLTRFKPTGEEMIAKEHFVGQSCIATS